MAHDIHRCWRLGGIGFVSLRGSAGRFGHAIILLIGIAKEGRAWRSVKGEKDRNSSLARLETDAGNRFVAIFGAK